jgi:hypothetical protein
MLLRDKLKGLIMKLMLAYRDTAFTNHGQINICCLSVTSLIKPDWPTQFVRTGYLIAFVGREEITRT